MPPGAARLVLVLLALGCQACEPVVSDRGFIGSWGRGDTQAMGRSIISFWSEADGTLRFRANRWSADGTHSLRCGRQGPCLEFSGAKPTFEYTYVVRRGETVGAVLVECEGRSLDGEPVVVHEVERFTLRPGGLGLDVARLEWNHQPIADPFVRATFHKISNDPFARAP